MRLPGATSQLVNNLRASVKAVNALVTSGGQQDPCGRRMSVVLGLLDANNWVGNPTYAPVGRIEAALVSALAECGTEKIRPLIVKCQTCAAAYAAAVRLTAPDLSAQATPEQRALEEATAKMHPRKQPAKARKLELVQKDSTLGIREKLEAKVKIHAEAVKDFIEFTKGAWKAYIDIANGNRKTMIPATELDYRAYDSNKKAETQLLEIVTNALNEPALTDEAAMQMKESLKANVLEYWGGHENTRVDLLYQEIEEWIESLCKLTCTTRSQTVLTGPGWASSKPFAKTTAQLRLMRACLDVDGRRGHFEWSGI